MCKFLLMSWDTFSIIVPTDVALVFSHTCATERQLCEIFGFLLGVLLIAPTRQKIPLAGSLSNSGTTRREHREDVH